MLFTPKNKDTWNSWSSWSSPVGLGIFYFLTTLSVAIALYTLLNIVGGVMAIARPPEAFPMQQGIPAGLDTGAGAGAQQ